MGFPPSGSIRIAQAAAALAIAAHLAVSFAGSIEQSRFYRFKAALPASLLRGATAMLDASIPNPAPILIRATTSVPDSVATPPSKQAGAHTRALSDGVPLTPSREASSSNGPTTAPSSSLPTPAAGSTTPATIGVSPALIVVAWLDEPDFTAKRIAAFDAQRRWRWIGETTHPIYVRPAAILGAVYPADLLHMAGASRGLYVREARPEAAARALHENRFVVMPFAPGPAPEGAPANPAAWVAGELQRSLSTGELPQRVQPPAMTPLRLAYLEPTDRRGAFKAEYSSAVDQP